MQKHSFQMSAPAPFSLKATVLSHGWHECQPMSWSEGGKCFQVIERLGDRCLRISVMQKRLGVGHHRRSVPLHVTVDGPSLDGATSRDVRNRLRVMLGLNMPLDGFYALCRRHPLLSVVPEIGAGRTVRCTSMTENVIKVICGTNVTWSQAVKMINRMAQLGPHLPHFRNLNAWPTPREILGGGERYLKDVCRLGYRAGSILAICRGVCDGKLDLEELDRMAGCPDTTDDDLLARLTSIRGIGPTSAHYLLSFLGRHGRVAIDSSTIAHVARTHMNGKKPTPKQINEIYAPYGKWQHLVWWHEHWLTWETARQIMHEAGLLGTGDAKPRLPT